MSASASNGPHVKMIPIERIRIINPRSRNRGQHKEIVDNISRAGLKRPITVSQRVTKDNRRNFDLICGEGRIEAYTALGQKRIPALVRTVSVADCLLMSLVENIARRRYQPITLLEQIGRMHKRNRSFSDIGKHVGMSPSWIRMIVGLLNNGEERLLSAVDSGILPLSLATDFAKAGTDELQALLATAYADGALTGKQLIQVRQLLDRRSKHSKTFNKGARPMDIGYGRKMTATDLRRLYQREASRQAVAAKKADFAHEKLAFVTEAFRDLLADKDFGRVLRAEACQTIPKALADRLGAVSSQ